MTRSPQFLARVAAADLASRQDYSCLMIGDVWTPADGGDYQLDVLEVRRFAHGSYARQVEQIAGILHHERVGSVSFGYDFGGVGAAVADLFFASLRVYRLQGYMWVGGLKDGESGGVRTISKCGNVKLLERLIGERRLGLPPLPERRDLQRELSEFRVVTSPTTGYESFSGGGAHDDMVMTLLLLSHMAHERTGGIGYYP